MPQYFTLDEASRLLPLLREFVLQAQERTRRLDKIRRQQAILAMKATGNGRLLEEEVREKRSAIEKGTRALDDPLQQIALLGCEIKGIEQGLIDFLSLREGREVYLCWATRGGADLSLA